jgi:hypothetical protein
MRRIPVVRVVQRVALGWQVYDMATFHSSGLPQLNVPNGIPRPWPVFYPPNFAIAYVPARNLGNRDWPFCDESNRKTLSTRCTCCQLWGLPR